MMSKQQPFKQIVFTFILKKRRLSLQTIKSGFMTWVELQFKCDFDKVSDSNSCYHSLETTQYASI